jgi:hypothetical protein
MTEAPAQTVAQPYRPQPWELMSPAVDWTLDAREKHLPLSLRHTEDVSAMADLVETLSKNPTVYWNRVAAERQLSKQFGIPTNAARTALRDAPHSSLIEGRSVWCAASAVAAWGGFKQSVFLAVKVDDVLTFEEIVAAVKDADPTSVHAALVVLVGQRSIVCLQDVPDKGPFYCRARPGLGSADYTDLVRVRGLSAPPAAA